MMRIVVLAFEIIWTTFGVWLVGRIEDAGHSWTWRLGGWVVFGVGSLALMALTI